MSTFEVTEQARPKLEKLLEESGNPDAYLRISIDGVR